MVATAVEVTIVVAILPVEASVVDSVVGQGVIRPIRLLFTTEKVHFVLRCGVTWSQLWLARFSVQKYLGLNWKLVVR